MEIIRHRGYAAQVHTVTTEDGYILELHRILPIDGVAVGRPVFLHHGLMGASSDWILNPTHKSLGNFTNYVCFVCFFKINILFNQR